MDEQKAKRIAELNYPLRLDFFVPTFGPRPVPGRIVCTRGISASPPQTHINIWSAEFLAAAPEPETKTAHQARKSGPDFLRPTLIY